MYACMCLFVFCTVLKGSSARLEKHSSIECLEIVDLVHNKNVVIAFDLLSAADNLEGLKAFEQFLICQQHRYGVWCQMIVIMLG
jgi:hypothetical protein